MAASTSLSPEERRLRARIASNTRWARASAEQRAAQARKAQDGLLRKFAAEVDPDGVLPLDERLRRAENARQSHMARLSLAASRARTAAAARKAAS